MFMPLFGAEKFEELVDRLLIATKQFVEGLPLEKLSNLIVPLIF
jgi:hypothetical protein